MATTIVLKNSVTTTNTPSSLAQGEVAINVTDKKVWVGNAATTPIQIVNGGPDGVFTSVTDSGLTSTRVTYAGTGGLLKDSANITTDGTTLTATKFSGALNGTVGATTPSTGAFTSASLNGSTSGAVTLAVPAIAGTNTVTIAAQTGTLNAAGPAFSAYASAVQTITTGTFTKVTLDVEDFDTNTNFASNRFTPTVAGYYQLNCLLLLNGTISTIQGIVALYKNGTAYSRLVNINPAASLSVNDSIAISGSILVYLNGSTDYVEMYGYYTGGTASFSSTSTSTTSRFNGCLVRGA